MTTEEKAYKDSLLRAKTILNGPFKNQCYDAIIQIFPELKESQDDGIRETMIQYFTELKKYGYSTTCISEDDCIAYLEKQKEPYYSPLCNTVKDKIREYIGNHFIADTVVKTDMKSIVKAMEEGVRLGKEEQKPLLTEETELNSLAFLEQMGYTCIPPGKEQKPAEVTPNQFDGITYEMQGYSTDKSPEWSEEDKIMLNSIIWHVRNSVNNGDITYSAGQLEDWLKSLRPQPHWKPSEEQMRAVFDASERNDKLGSVLRNLYDELKKL